MSEPETCALPLGFTDRMRRLLGAEYPAFLASYDKPRRPALRVNPLRLDGIPDGVRVLLPFLAERVPFTAAGTIPTTPPCVPADTRTMRRGCTIFRRQAP